MRIIRNPENHGPRVVALGTFDGVHLGHQELIRQGKTLAETLGAKLRVCVFDRHPMEVLCPEKAPSMLTTADEQAERMRQLGVDELRVFPFTRETADMPPEAFLASLREECGLLGMVAGWNYTFGRKGLGNEETLRADAELHGTRALIVPPVRTGAGEIISSTAVREKLLRGDVEGAREMLGMPYEISGTVADGKHMGSKIGCPTANIRTAPRKLMPAYGVYACRTRCGDEEWNAVVNIGLQPTLPSGEVTVETHILGADPALYGKRATVRLMRYLRPERKFDSVEALREQIREDERRALAVL